MVRNYRRKERIYPVDTLRKAVRQVLLRELTSSEAGRLYKIPRTTIINHVNGRSSGFNRGRRPVFTYDQEKMIVELTLAMSDSGVGLDMRIPLSIAKPGVFVMIATCGVALIVCPTITITVR